MRSWALLLLLGPLALPSTVGAAPRFAVGFCSHLAFDPSRTYRTAFDDGATYGATGAPRPIVVNLWYPAQAGGEPMARAGYLPSGDDPATVRLLEALVRYERDVIGEELFDAPEEKLSDEQRAQFDAYLAAPTAAVRDALPAVGPFPLLLYHAGAGSSCEDDAERCEEFASRGYVVASSLFLDGDGESFGIDGGAESVRDLGFLVAAARVHPFVARGRVGAWGHSAGAQALLRFAAAPPASPDAAAIDALALLDTTQDYQSLADPRWSFVAPVLAAVDEVDETLLFAANPHAFFAVGDALRLAERRYLTLPDVDHNEFIAQGVTRARLAAQRDPESEEGQRAAHAAAMERALTDALLAFFAEQLQGDVVAGSALGALEQNVLAGPAPRVERMERGATAPPPWSLASGRAPSPRQLRPALESFGAPALIAALEERRAGEPTNPVFATPWFAYALLFELVVRDRVDDARALYDWYRTLHGDRAVSMVASQLALSEQLGWASYVPLARKVGRALAPERPEWGAAD